MFSNQNVHKAFQSILRADYISITDSRQLEMLGKYYVDIFNNLPIILQEQDNFVNGRRGTGKTTLLMRAYYECLKSISPQIKDMFEEADEQLLERFFVGKIVSELKTQLATMFELEKIKILKKDKSNLPEFEYIEEVLKSGIDVKIKKEDERTEVNLTQKDNIEGSISLTDTKISDIHASEQENRVSYSVEKIKGVSVQEFLVTLGDIRKKVILTQYIFLLMNFQNYQVMNKLGFQYY